MVLGRLVNFSSVVMGRNSRDWPGWESPCASTGWERGLPLRHGVVVPRNRQWPNLGVRWAGMMTFVIEFHRRKDDMA